MHIVRMRPFCFILLTHLGLHMGRSVRLDFQPSIMSFKCQELVRLLVSVHLLSKHIFIWQFCFLFVVGFMTLLLNDFGKIGLLGPLPLAQSAVRSMGITARAT